MNENDEKRKRFEIMAREVFKKFKACITIRGINEYRQQYDAINIIYKSLQEDRDKADIADIIRKLHEVVDNVIQTYNNDTTADDFTTYDIRNGDEITSPTMHHRFRPPLHDLKSQKYQNSLLFHQLL